MQETRGMLPSVLAGVLVATTVVAGIVSLLVRRRGTFVALLATVLLLQNLIVMVLLRLGWVSGVATQALLATKELLVIVAIAVLGGAAIGRAVVRGRVRTALVPMLSVVWFAIVAVHGLLFGPPWLARIAGARSLVILPALYLLGYLLARTPDDIRHTVRVLFVIGTALALFGLLEAYVLPDAFWLSIGHEEFYLEKIGRPIQGVLYGNMRFWFEGEPIRRVASLTGDPLISSYPMALVIVLVGARYIAKMTFRARHLLAIVPIGLAALLTLSRGAVLTIAIALALALLGRRSPRFMTSLVLFGLVTIVATTALFGDAILTVTTGAGHIDELVDGLRRGIERPFGHGLGSASSVATGVARARGLADVVVGGGDSYLGSLATQMGLPAALFFYGLMVLMIANLIRHYRWARLRAPEDAWWFLAIAAMLAGLLVTSTVNESGFGFVASGMTYLLAGSLASLARAARLPTQVPRVVPTTATGGVGA